MRAVHLKIAYSLTLDSRIKAITRFLCHYGFPTISLYSDIGTNFHGADKTLKNIMKSLDHDKYQRNLRHRGIN